MRIEVIRSLSDLQNLSKEWNTLLGESASHVPFLRHEYLAAWWGTLGGGEWPQGDLYVITVRQEDGRLVGIAPFFFTQNRQDEPALMFLGSIEISDYLDFIAPPQDLPLFLDALMDYFESPSAPAWRVVDLYNILESSPTLPILRSLAVQRGCRYEQEHLQHCPYIPLPGDWQAYLDGIDKKQRHEIRRKMRRADDNFPPVTWRIVEDGSSLDEEMEAFFKLMAYDEEKRRFLTPAMRTQMKTTAQVAHREGWLQLAFAEVGGERAAAYLNFDYRNQIWVYNSGFSPAYRELSLGWVLLGHLIVWAIEHKRAAYDFMRGDEDYKYRFGAVDRHVVRAILRR